MKSFARNSLLAILLLLSGCGGGLAALQVIQTGAIGAMAYHTWTKEDPPLYTSECAWVEEFKPDPGFEERWTRGEKIQAVIHNDRVANCPAKEKTQ